MTETTWNGYKQMNFTVGGRTSYIVCPEKALPGNSWVWRTEFFEAFNYVDRALLERGWHLAYHCVSDMYGCPESVSMMKEFYDTAVNEYGMSSKPAMFGFSRGALYAVNFALKYPDCCGLLYLDAPVLDICSWPGGLGAGLGEESCWKECKEIYHLNDETALTFTGNPLDRTKELAKTGIPVMLVCGDADRYVPYAENGEPFYEKMKEAGADIMLIVKPGCDHHPHSLSDPAPVVDFIEKHYGIK